jgi:predicted small secreted protein
MKRFMLSSLVACSMILGSISMTGCNMVAGMGKDTQETGQIFTGTPPNEAYHQEARNF